MKKNLLPLLGRALSQFPNRTDSKSDPPLGCRTSLLVGVEIQATPTERSDLLFFPIPNWGITALLFLLSFTALNAQNSLQATRVDQPPKIDGILDDEAWKNATSISNFVQREPDPGQEPSLRTEVNICYGEKEIYIAFKCYDDPDRITAKELKRDISLSQDDRVQFIFDTFLDRRNGYWFQIGPRGCIGDALVSDNGAAFNKQWDGLWEGKATIHEEGWSAEAAIPFTTLNFRPGQDTWGLKILRHIKRNLERVDWPEANLNTYTFQISDAGLLTGLEGMSQGIGLDIRPYALAGLDQKTDTKNEYLFDAGGDIFYQVSSGLNAALTINTDFAQTEVDSRQINLTRFALFFPEKRNFFLDGANYFNFGFASDRDNPYQSLIPYFSRSIGLDAEGNPIPIIVGGKLAGQAGNWNIGALNITDRADSTNRNFTVARVTRNIGKQSYIGMIGTKGDAINTVDNWQGGLDFRIATSKFRGNKNLAFRGFGLKSHTKDLDGKDFSYGLDVSYPNDFMKFRLGHQAIGENFRSGIGFVRRTGIRETYSSFFLGPRPNKDNKLGILQINTGGMLDYITDFDGKLLTRDMFLKVIEVEFRSGETAEYAWANTYDLLNEDFQIYSKDGKEITIDEGLYKFWQQSIELSTAPRRNYWVALELEWGDFFDGKRTTYNLSSGMQIAVPFFLGLEFEQNDVHLSEGDFTTQVYRVTADINFSPDISLSNFLQYDNLSERLGIQSRFRWILKPGKEVLLVWNSLRQPDPLDRFAEKVAENSLRFKLNYTFRF